jgi:hypothetical protein
MYEECCQDCHYVRCVGDDKFECHVDAPKIIDPLGMAAWPQVQPTDWCGEYLTDQKPIERLMRFGGAR